MPSEPDSWALDSCGHSPTNRPCLPTVPSLDWSAPSLQSLSPLPGVWDKGCPRRAHAAQVQRLGPEKGCVLSWGFIDGSRYGLSSFLRSVFSVFFMT